MRILYWNSESDRFDKILDDLALHFELIEFSEISEVCEFINDESADAIIFNYDDSKKEIDKAIKSIKKIFEIPIFLHTNSLDSKQLVKHQKSKTSADLYLRSPVSKELLLTMIAPFTDEEVLIPINTTNTESIDIEESTDEIQVRRFQVEPSASVESNQPEVNLVINQHLPSTQELPEDIKKLNEKLNKMFTNVDELDDFSLTDEDISLGDKFENTEELILSDDQDDGLLLLDDEDTSIEDSIDLIIDDEDSDELLSLEDNEVDLGDNDDLLELSDDEEPDTLLNLDSSDDEDLLVLDDNLEDEEVIGIEGDIDDSADLEMATLELGDDEPDSINTSDDGLEMSLDDDLSLDLSDDEDIDSQPMEESGLELDLSSSEELEIGDDESSLDMDAGDDGLDLDLSDSNELSLGEDNFESNLGDDDQSGIDMELEDNVPLDLDDDQAETLSADIDDNDEFENSIDDQEVNLGNLDLSELESDDSDFEESIEFGDEDVVETSFNLADMDSIDSNDEDSPESDLSLTMGDDLASDEDDEAIDETIGEHTDSIQRFGDDELFGSSNEESTNDAINSNVTRVDDQSLEFSLSEASGDQIETSIDFSNDAKMKLSEIDNLMDDSLNNSSDVLSDTQESDEESADREVFVAEHRELKERNNQQLEGLALTIRALRDDRESLIEKISKLENKESDKIGHELNLKAQLDEKSIEVNVLRNRYQKNLENLKVELDISLEKKTILEEKSKYYEQKIEDLNKRVRVDVNLVRQREKELENKLEMLRSDSEAQIRNRDLKILELKRKIDTLEFDIESVQSQEKKVVHNKYELEEKMEKVIDTLRGAIGELEDDGSFNRKIKNIKKNLDV